MNRVLYNYSLIALAVLFAFRCASTKEYSASVAKVPSGSKIAIFVEGNPEQINAASVEFMKAGYKLSAAGIGALYSPALGVDAEALEKAIFLAKTSNTKEKTVLERLFSGAYQLELFRYEVNKLNELKKLKKDYDVDYVLLLSIKPWDTSYSWARAIRLKDLNVIYVHNFMASKKDTLQTQVQKIIQEIQG